MYCCGRLKRSHRQGWHAVLSWHYAANMKFFKQTTAGDACVMGRRTWRRLKNPWPNRLNFALSGAAEIPEQESVIVLHDVQSVSSLAVRLVLHNSNSGKYGKCQVSLAVVGISHVSCSQKYLGVPFNITSYALLIHLVAHVCGLEVGNFIYTLGDYHIYQNHLDQVNQLLLREPLPLPRLMIRDDDQSLRGLDGLLAMQTENLRLVGYSSHAKIAAPVAV
jgi:Thymidylate synthase/Dihydrofolate reductase